MPFPGRAWTVWGRGGIVADFSDAICLCVLLEAEDAEIVNTGLLSGEADFIRESTVLVKIPFCVENRPKGHRLLDMHVDSSSV